MSATVRKSAGTCRVKAPVLQLVPSHSRTDAARSAETVLLLRQMLELAECGEIQGFAYVVLRPKRRVTCGMVGTDGYEELVTHWIQKLYLKIMVG